MGKQMGNESRPVYQTRVSFFSLSEDTFCDQHKDLLLSLCKFESAKKHAVKRYKLIVNDKTLFTYKAGNGRIVPGDDDGLPTQ